MKILFSFCISLFFCACASVSATEKRGPAQSGGLYTLGENGSLPKVCYGAVHFDTLDSERKNIRIQTKDILKYVEPWHFIAYMQAVPTEKGLSVVFQDLIGGEHQLKAYMNDIVRNSERSLKTTATSEFLGCK